MCTQSACCTGGRLISRGRGTLAQERPDLADQWDVEGNGNITPETVQAGSSHMATWRCGKCCMECGKAHVWQSVVQKRTCGGTNCPLCSGRQVCSCQSLAKLRSDLLIEWDKENSLDSHTLACASRQKALWTCAKNPEHGSWSATIFSRAALGSGCPKCAHADRRKPKAGRGLLKDEFPEVYAQVHPIPWSLEFLEGLTSGSGRPFWWRCTAEHHRPPGCRCDHMWQVGVQDRCHKSNGCPYCSGRRACLCTSIAKKAPGLLEFWHCGRNASITPQKLGVYSSKRVWWRHICSTTGEEHEWQAIVSGVCNTYISKGRIPCPVCSSRANRERLAKANKHAFKK